jgi:uncharacterized protein (DUF697 family)/GTP-binding protein EngB required for normal cell division
MRGRDVVTETTSPGEDGIDRERFEKEFAAEAHKIGRINIALFGKTGAGKSTLLNAVFGRDVTATGSGAPVTRGSRLHIHQDGFLGIIDNEGLEIGKDSADILGDLERLVEANRAGSLADQVHLAWYCVRAGDHRFEDTEADFIRGLAALGVPVILVLTRAMKTPTGEVHPETVEFARYIEGLELPIDGRVVITSAIGDIPMGFGEFGLQELLDCSFRVAPEGVQLAFVAAQKYDMDRKGHEAQKAITAAVTAATAAGATPIPFSDAAILVPIQIAMMVRIANLYDLGLQRSTALAVTATTVATQAGRSLVTGLLKFIPGVNLAAMAISAGVAGAITFGMGEAWHLICRRIAAGELDAELLSDTEMLGRVFVEEFKRASASKLGKLPSSNS